MIKIGINKKLINKNINKYLYSFIKRCMRDFRSFSNENKKIIDENIDKANEYSDMINKYKDMDNNQLMSTLFSEASKLKREGKLDSATLNSMQSTLAPFLNSEQQEYLSQLIKQIDEQK